MTFLRNGNKQNTASEACDELSRYENQWLSRKIVMALRYKSKLATIFSEASFAISHSPEPSRDNYALFAIFCIINYLVPLFVFFPSDGNPYSWTFSLRICGQLLCVGLLLFSLIPREMKILRALYWHATLLFCLPVLSTVMYFSQPESSFWYGSFFLSILLLATLENSRVFLISLLFGVAFGGLTYGLMENFSPLPFEKVFSFAYVVIFSSAVGLVFARKRESEIREKIESLRKLSATIAHEMRTPLATISITSKTYERYIGKIVKFYKEHRHHVSGEAPTIEPHILDYLETSPKDLYNNSRRNLLLIDMMLKKYRGVDGVKQLRKCSINECLNAALAEYSFAPNQSHVVSIDKVEEFTFLADETLFIHVVFNLISNSLRHLPSPYPGAIKLWTTSTAHANNLHFYDHGAGIPSHLLRDIFSLRTNYKEIFGSGIGLNFCYQAMRRFGGSIQCKSDGQTHTEFILTFPKLRAKVKT